MCIDKTEKMKKILLSLLDTDEVQQKIRSILSVSGRRDVELSVPGRRGVECVSSIGSSDLENSLRQQLSDLKKNVQQLEQQKKILEENLETNQRESVQKDRKIRELSIQIDGLQAENKKNISSIQRMEQDILRAEEMKNKLRNLESSYSEYQSIFQLFLALPSSLKTSLKGIFNGSDLWSFVICGAQPERLMDFWDFCMRDFKRGKLIDQKEKLVKIFDFFFEKINSTLNETPLYLRQEIKKGMSFDTAYHTATSDSDAVGRIQEILLPGIVYANSQKVLKKSVVIVRN